jgi:peptidoglycan/LPS O-acetylase OafA/YrhL
VRRPADDLPRVAVVMYTGFGEETVGHIPERIRLSATHEHEAPAVPPSSQLSTPHALWSADQFGGEAERPLGPFRRAHARFLDLFVVSSSSGASLAYLDGIRGVAVALIVVFHCWILSGTPPVSVTVPLVAHTENLTIFFAASFVGVNLFFVLSGFLLSQYWLRADFAGKGRPSTRRYFRHRLFRIVPAYYFTLLLTLIFLCPFLIPPELIYSRTGAFILGAHLTFTQYLFPISSSSYGINGPMWTLTMEMIFYLVLPWLVLLFLRWRWLVTLPICIAVSLGWLYLAKHALGPVVRYWQTENGLDEATVRYFLSQQFPAHLANFACGMVLANLYSRYRSADRRSRPMRLLTSPWVGNLAFVIGMVLVIGGMERFRHADALYYRYYGWELTVSIGFSLVIAGLFMGSGALRWLFGITPLRFIGIVGYSAYLWHMPLIYLINKYPAIAALPPEQRFHRVTLCTAVAVALISGIVFLAVEKPFLLLGRRQPETVPPAALPHTGVMPEVLPAAAQSAD